MSKLFYCIVSAIIGFLLSEFKSPAIEYWTERFGSPEERTLQDYREMKSESQKDSTLQEALSWQAEKDSILAANFSIRLAWQAEKDSLKRFYERKALLCLEREIERGKEKPCESSIYYRKIYSDRTIWLIGSTECPQDFLASPNQLPTSLLNRGWLNRHLAPRPSIKQQDIARINEMCNEKENNQSKQGAS